MAGERDDQMRESVLHVAGARPNFPKAAPVIQALSMRGVPQQLVHTGQHYDARMSEIFFRELGLPEPDVNLNVGSGSHAEQTGAIMIGLERFFVENDPAVVVVYGDVNSTVAAALVAAKLQIPLAHVEGGLRSFDRSMPEEVNRIVTDRLADLLFVTSPDAVANLGNEGVHPSKIYFVGNPMIDTLLGNIALFDSVLARKAHELPDCYVVTTLHRPSNVDNPDDAQALVKAMHAVADQADVLLPLHPRGRGVLLAAGLARHPRLRIIDPVGYVEFISLVHGAAVVVTDSGGIQEEATILGVPCLTLRPNTERPITITHGTNQLVTRDSLADRVGELLALGKPSSWPVPPLWDGNAGERIADAITTWLHSRANGLQVLS